jgi:ABC-type branched-subunit amino acid transport system ATPase component
MLRTINVLPDTKLSKILFFDEVDFEQFPERVVPLFGPNGVGKQQMHLPKLLYQ